MATNWGLCDELCEKVGNLCVSQVFDEGINLIRALYEDGWELTPCFYGEKTEHNGTSLKMKLIWFRFNGIYYTFVGKNECIGECDHLLHPAREIVSYMLCWNDAKNELWLYDASCDDYNEPHLMGRFDCYYDLKRCLSWLDSYVPAKMVYSRTQTVDDLGPNKGVDISVDSVMWRVDTEKVKLLVV